MRIGVIPENLPERIVLASGMVPIPLLDTQIAFLLARTIMVGTKLGVFESLASGPLRAEEIATHCKTNLFATKKLLDALSGASYLRADGERYTLSALARKWLLKESPQSLYDKMLFQFMEWDLIEHYEDFIRNGKPRDIHGILSKEEWGLYQRGMRSMVGTWASEVKRRTPVPKGAQDMLDVGGSHGYYSVALCQRHPNLRSVILELPEAVDHAAPFNSYLGISQNEHSSVDPIAGMRISACTRRKRAAVNPTPRRPQRQRRLPAIINQTKTSECRA